MVLVHVYCACRVCTNCMLVLVRMCSVLHISVLHQSSSSSHILEDYIRCVLASDIHQRYTLLHLPYAEFSLKKRHFLSFNCYVLPLSYSNIIIVIQYITMDVFHISCNAICASLPYAEFS